MEVVGFEKTLEVGISFSLLWHWRNETIVVSYRWGSLSRGIRFVILIDDEKLRVLIWLWEIWLKLFFVLTKLSL